MCKYICYHGKVTAPETGNLKSNYRENIAFINLPKAPEKLMIRIADPKN